jgi:hypothetical protein
MLADNLEFDYEEISTDEVDRVTAALEQLSAGVASQTIREFLEVCSTDIHFLVYDDEAGDFEAAA